MSKRYRAIKGLPTIKQLMKAIDRWSDKTFSGGFHYPDRAKAISYHLQKESVELTDAVTTFLDKPSEKNRNNVNQQLADCQILIWDICNKLRINATELLEYSHDKHQVNLARSWGKPDENGVIEHIRAIGPTGLRINPGDWQVDFSSENGNYQNTCIKCDNTFMGHKYRTICKTCADIITTPNP